MNEPQPYESEDFELELVKSPREVEQDSEGDYRLTDRSPGQLLPRDIDPDTNQPVAAPAPEGHVADESAAPVDDGLGQGEQLELPGDVADPIQSLQPADDVPASLPNDLDAPPEGMSVDQIVGALFRSGLSQDQIESIPDGHAATLKEAIQEAVDNGVDPTVVVETFADHYKRELREIERDQRLERVESYGGLDERARMEHEAREIAERETEAWFQDQQSRHMIALEDVKLQAKDAGVTLDEQRLLVTMHRAGVIGVLEPEQAIQVGLALMAAGGDPLKAMAAPRGADAPGGRQVIVEGKGPTARVRTINHGSAPRGGVAGIGGRSGPSTDGLPDDL